MRPPLGRPKEGSLPPGGKARSAKGVPLRRRAAPRRLTAPGLFGAPSEVAG